MFMLFLLFCVLCVSDDGMDLFYFNALIMISPGQLLGTNLRKPPIPRNAASRRSHRQGGLQHPEMYPSHSLLCYAQTTGDSSHSQRGRLTACLSDESIADNTENCKMK